jgi:hypothetical protein
MYTMFQVAGTCGLSEATNFNYQSVTQMDEKVYFILFYFIFIFIFPIQFQILLPVNYFI